MIAVVRNSTPTFARPELTKSFEFSFKAYIPNKQDSSIECFLFKKFPSHY